MKTNATVTAVSIFPVRSCAGFAVPQAQITPNGLLFDRQWRLVTGEGKFLTQNDAPAMALIKPVLVGSTLQLSCVRSKAAFVVDGGSDGATDVTISHSCKGIDQGDLVSEWLSSILGINARLLRVASVENHFDFARPNMSPVLVISEESLADLNRRLETPVLMNRFRPNLIVRGMEPYEEESWTEVAIGDVVYEASSEPCGRCPMINIDQENGVKSGKEPLKTLATYRRIPGHVIFGKYMVPKSPGIVRVGDRIKAV